MCRPLTGHQLRSIYNRHTAWRLLLLLSSVITYLPTAICTFQCWFGNCLLSGTESTSMQHSCRNGNVHHRTSHKMMTITKVYSDTPSWSRLMCHDWADWCNRTMNSWAMSPLKSLLMNGKKAALAVYSICIVLITYCSLVTPTYQWIHCDWKRSLASIWLQTVAHLNMIFTDQLTNLAVFKQQSNSYCNAATSLITITR